MIKEYIEKLDMMYKFFRTHDEIYRNMGVDICQDEFMKNFYEPMNDLLETKDQEVLECLLDFIDEDFELNVGGVIETLTNGIGDNFSLSNILRALAKKINQISNKHLWRAGELCMWFLWHDMFDEFREMFNTVKPELAEKLLAEMLSWDRHKLRYTQHINLLRDDMKSW